MHLWPISKNDLSACNYIFLDLNLVGNTKKHERIQNFHILWKMYRENWPLEANFRQKWICKKKCTPSIWPKSKIPDIQVVQIDICDKLYRRDFWFFKNWGQVIFFTEKNIFGFTFHLIEQNMQYFGNHLPVAAVLKLKWKLSDQGYWKMTKGTVSALFVMILEASLPKRCIFFTRIGKKLSRPVI